MGRGQVATGPIRQIWNILQQLNKMEDKTVKEQNRQNWSFPDALNTAFQSFTLLHNDNVKIIY